jgi:hypothetical protein
MKLEDFFKREIASEPKKQESVPESSLLTQFFSKRTPKEVAPIIPETIENVPLDQTKVEEIKTTYSPQQDRLVPVSDVVDVKKIKQQAQELSPEMGWGDVFASLTPLAVEAIFGGNQAYSASPDIAAQSLLSDFEKSKKRKQSLEDKLMELKTIKGTKRGGGLQMKSLVDKTTGEKSIGVFDPSGVLTDLNGNILDPQKFAVSSGLTEQEFAQRQKISGEQQIKTARELGRDLRVDPTTGLLGRWEGDQFKPAQTPMGSLSPTQKKDLDSTVSKFTSSDAFKKPLITLQAASSVDALLQDAVSGNPTAAEMARSELAKMAEGGSRLSDQDVQRIGGDQSIRGIANRYVNLQRTGMPLTPKDLENLRNVADTLYKVSRVKMMDSVGGLEKAYIQKGGVPGAVQTAILPFIPASPKARTTPMSSLQKGGMVKVVSPEGKEGSIPFANLQKALQNGYKRVP